MLPFSPPCIGDEEIDEIVDTLRSAWINRGPKTRQFESEFARYVHSPAALAVNSGTAALQVALAAAEIGPGDEVITSTMTFCATVHVIEQAGARPVLVDVEPDTLNIDPVAVERAISGRTRAIIPVHLYGHPAEMDALNAIAASRRLWILEDAAHALPARYRGRMIGSIGHATAFSFYATKNITTGDGGMLTADPAFIQSARPWSLHGMTRDAYSASSIEDGWSYDVDVPGFKCNMTDLQASLGIQQLRKLDRFHQRRRRIAGRYRELLSKLPEIQIPVERPQVESAWHLYPIRIDATRLSLDRRGFIEELRRRNVATSVHFVPVHLFRYYRDKYRYRPEDFPTAYREFLRLVTLPLSPGMSDQDVEDVIAAVSDTISRHRAKAHAVSLPGAQSS
jgi:dTDP-4-amino-4,6-dideoxygalactose transaminase